MNKTTRNLALAAALVTALIAVLAALPEPDRDPPRGGDSTGSGSPSVAITGVRLFDGERVVPDATVVFADGRVSAAGAGVEPPAEARIVDGSGRTLLPGLIDAHVHAFGSARADALRFGVTTMLDMFTPPMAFETTRAERQRLTPTDRADLFSAGYLATAEGGHGTQYGIDVPTPDGPESAAAWVRARLDEGSDYIKIVIEDGANWSGELPTLDAATVSALVEAAHEEGVLAIAHVSSRAGARIAIEAGVDGLAHVFGDSTIDETFVRGAREAGVFVIPTATVLASAYGESGAAWIREHPVLGPRLSTGQRRSLGETFSGAAERAAFLMRVGDNISRLHAGGVPLLAGSDAPNPGTAHGASLHHELVLLVRSGLEPVEALRAATSVPARVFGLETRGCLETGCRADAVLVAGDPTRRIADSAAIERVWKNGHAVELAPPGTESARARSAPAAAPVDLLAEPTRWVAASDRYMDGASIAETDAMDDALGVRGRLEPGFAFPYAGTMWYAATTPMQPADHSGHDQLVIEVASAHDALQVMFFSGDTATAAPIRRPIGPGETTTIAFDELAGLSPRQLRAIGVFAVGAPGPFAFEIRKARLE